LSPQVTRERLFGLLARFVRDRRGDRRDPAVLARSAVLVHWPRWLVDLHVQGTFFAEVAIPYRGAGSVERWEGGRWVTATEAVDRTVWELRAGRADRRLHDLEVPASSEEDVLAPLAQDGQPAAGAGGPVDWVLLPDIWPSNQDEGVEDAARAALERQVLQATLGERARDLHVSLVGSQPSWTLVLRPIWWIPDPSGGEAWLVDGLTGRVLAPPPGSEAERSGWTAVVVGAAVLGLLGVVSLLCLGLLGAALGGLT
jgi:hypothetical protein